jgi:phosphotransferase system  glucose/maltose/N-acetylglucosamine-specific IIC component
MDSHIFVAVIGALINMVLSTIIPCLVNKTDMPILAQVRKVFETNRQVILTSSLIVGITIYLALKVAPELEPSFEELTGIDIGSPMSGPLLINGVPLQLRNLVRLS